MDSIIGPLAAWPVEPPPRLLTPLRLPVVHKHRVHTPLAVCTTGSVPDHFFHGLVQHGKFRCAVERRTDKSVLVCEDLDQGTYPRSQDACYDIC